MKIKTWIKYEESYVPPRCRKLRYRECEDYINVNLKEVAPDEMRLAFEDNSYSGKGKIYYYKGKLWSKVKSGNFMCNPSFNFHFYSFLSVLFHIIFISNNNQTLQIRRCHGHSIQCHQH